MEKIDTKIHFKTAIKSSPEIIYPLITTSKGWDSWFTKGMVFNLEKNSEALFSWVNWGADKITESERAVVLDFVPNKYLKFEWNFFLPDGPTTVEISLVPRAEDTIIEVNQWGFHNNKSGLQMLTQCSLGWAEALTLLRFYVEHKISYN